MLAGLPPVYGLYVSFVAPILYALFGRCPQASLGTFAVVSLLMAEPIERLCAETTESFGGNTTNTEFPIPVCYVPDDTSTGEYFDYRPVIAITLSFLIGIVQISIGVLMLGKLTCYLAPAMVDGFVTGAACHVFSSQVASLFGIKQAKKGDGVGSLFLVFYNLFKHIRKTNLITLAISGTSICFLLLIKLFIEPQLQRCGHCKFPVPSELMLVAIGTVVSHFAELQNNHNVTIVGSITSGMPPISVPQWNLMSPMVTDAIIIGFTSTFLTISLVKLFAMKYNQDIDYNYLSGIPSGLLVIFVLLFLGPYFSVTPTCVLSAIIVVALKNIIAHLLHTPKLWRTYKRDFFLFMITFVVTLVLDVTIGLVVGLVACLLALTEQQRALTITLLDNLPGTELFLHGRAKLATGELHSTKFLYPLSRSIISCRLIGSLNFASSEQLESKITKVLKEHESRLVSLEDFEYPDQSASCNPSNTVSADSILETQQKHQQQQKQQNTTDKRSSAAEEAHRRFSSNLDRIEMAQDKTKKFYLEIHDEKEYAPQRFLLIDISGMTDVDPAGAICLSTVHEQFCSIGVVLVYIGNLSQFQCLDTSKWERFPSLSLSYPTMYDGYLACQNALFEPMVTLHRC
ncbi:sulfate transporter [Clonorchis sinensis]|uniref:Sulfate transporter n=1 Tax=Clonorchis sinensis TaxID=79923 RepID=H2KR67_CLOSI|nr:sulfate transporter [Clonorchis sinensis]